MGLGMPEDSYAGRLLERLEAAVLRVEGALKILQTDVDRDDQLLRGNGTAGLIARVGQLEKLEDRIIKLENDVDMLRTGSTVDEAKWYTYGKWGVALAAVSSFGMQVIQLIRDAGG